MRRRPLPGPAAVALVALLAGATAGEAQESRGSSVPCAVPMGWWIAELDPRFELTEAEAREAVAEAAGLWEAAARRPLFPHDPEGALAVSFVYGSQQARVQARREAEAELERLGARLDSARAAVEAARVELQRDRDDYDARIRDLLQRFDDFNREVMRWNREGGAPPDEQARLARLAESLQAEQRALQEEGGRLAAREQAWSAEAEALNARIEERNRRAREVTRAFAGELTEAGRYDERQEIRGREIRVFRRQVRIFRFDDRDDLVRVLAHELGHALGLGHTEDGQAVMGTVMEGREEPRLHTADLRLLAARCPMLR